MNIKPVGERILVKRLEGDTKTSGGIVIPDVAQEKPQRGEVVALGTGRRNEKGKTIPWEVKKGDVVLFGKYAGTDVQIGDEGYLFISEDDILAVF